MDIAIVSMNSGFGKFARLEHCCEGIEEKPVFHVEMYLFYYALKEQGISAEFFNGNFVSEEETLEKLRQNKPGKIIYYVYTPHIRKKEEFMKKLSEISDLYLVITPYFWRDKILKEFPFVKDAYYDGEKGLGISIKEAKINYDEIDLTPYLDGRAFPILISKYCPYQCSFCNARKTGLAERNLEKVKEEISYLINRGVRKFHLSSNMITIKRDTYFKICEMMKEFDVDEWSADGRVDQMTDDMYLPLKEARGTLLFGVESANQEILNKVGKGTKIEQIIRNADKLKSMNVPFRYTYIFGFPWDSYDTFKEMLELRDKAESLNYHVLYLMPFPSHPIYQDMKDLNLIDESKLDFDDFDTSFTEPFAPTLYLTKEEIKKLVTTLMTRRIFSRSVIKNIIKTRRVRDYPTVASRGLKLLMTGKRDWISG